MHLRLVSYLSCGSGSSLKQGCIPLLTTPSVLRQVSQVKGNGETEVTGNRGTLCSHPQNQRQTSNPLESEKLPSLLQALLPLLSTLPPPPREWGRILPVFLTTEHTQGWVAQGHQLMGEGHTDPAQGTHLRDQGTDTDGWVQVLAVLAHGWYGVDWLTDAFWITQLEPWKPIPYLGSSNLPALPFHGLRLHTAFPKHW